VEKYNNIKRKFKALSDETTILTDELTRAKKRIARLQKERSFLLDRLLKYEQVSSDSESSPSPLSSEEEERPRKRPYTIVEKKELPPPVRAPVRPRTNVKDKAKEEDIQMCAGRGKDDRPCKSKALPGFKHCWHHAPLDPNSPFIFCQYVDPTKRYPRKCSIPVAKDRTLPYCNYHVKRLEAGKAGGHIQENGEGEGEEVEVEGDDDANLLSGVEDSFDGSGEDGSPQPQVV